MASGRAEYCPRQGTLQSRTCRSGLEVLAWRLLASLLSDGNRPGSEMFDCKGQVSGRADQAEGRLPTQGQAVQDCRAPEAASVYAHRVMASNPTTACAGLRFRMRVATAPQSHQHDERVNELHPRPVKTTSAVRPAILLLMRTPVTSRVFTGALEIGCNWHAICIQ